MSEMIKNIKEKNDNKREEGQLKEMQHRRKIWAKEKRLNFQKRERGAVAKAMPQQQTITH